MAHFRKKPVVIEAVQWLGDNSKEIIDFLDHPDLWHTWNNPDNTLTIKTLEGNMIASVNDWIIKEIKGEIYPCKSDIFEATYEAVPE